MGRKVFGTDGIRGIANVYPITPEMALKVGKAVAGYFVKKNGGSTHKIVIGKDTRLSGYMLENALTSGIVSMGVNVLLVGPMPTPAIAHLTKSMNADAGIIISASHNPSEHNGIKIFSGNGFKLDDRVEEEIEKIMFSDSVENSHIKGEKIGKAFRVNDAKGRYIAFAKASIADRSLQGLKLVVDCANGAAYHLAEDIFSELGAEVIVLHNKPNGSNINLNCGALHPEKMQEAVKEFKADVGLALDGDADRVIFCDENGKEVDGDKILAMLAVDFQEREMLAKETVVATVMANAGFFEAMKKEGLNVSVVPVGDRYVVEEMQKKGFVLGGEQSGHMILGNYATTGDGLVTGLHVLDLMKRKKQKLSELAKCMQSFPQVLINIKVKEKKPFNELPAVQKEITAAEKELSEKGRVLVRYSGTEMIARVMIEGKNEKQINGLAQNITKAIEKELGE